jgi:2-amino-4-hydroxy-6-hydroxymethyldihydropteridine diphosphokinase
VGEAEDPTVQAALGLGGNVGDVAAAMAIALHALDQLAMTSVVSVSSLYSTPPWGKADQDWFTNACAIVETGLEPETLLDACLMIERRLKRDREHGERWGPRTIDIDILTFGDMAIGNSRLSVPHPRMTQRAFVLQPLAEIAPDLIIEGRSVADWANMVPAGEIERTAPANWWRRVG